MTSNTVARRPADRHSVQQDGRNMGTSEIVGILKDHEVPQSRDNSYKRYSTYNIRYLKNVGLLDCYYDYGSNQDMIFTTGFGKRYIELHDGNADLDELRDIVLVDRDLSSSRYVKAVRKAIGARTD